MTDIELRLAEQGDLARLAVMMGAAFMDDPVSAWLFPDDDDRAQRHPAFFRVFLDLAYRHGTVMTTTDLAAAALWLDIQGDEPELLSGETGDRLSAACGPNFGRFFVLDTLMKANHPDTMPHAYLPFIAVAPHAWGHGIGTALLDHQLAERDAIGRPAYLEASNVRSAKLYERLGFTRLPDDIAVANGPSLLPMWRTPLPIVSWRTPLADGRA